MKVVIGLVLGFILGLAATVVCPYLAAEVDAARVWYAVPAQP